MMEFKDEFKQYDKVLILSDDNKEFNIKLLEGFQKKIIQNRIKGIVVLDKGKDLYNHEIEFLSMNLEEIGKLYQLYKFTDKIIWGSLSKPYGRHWENLIFSGCLTEEQVVEAILKF